MAITMLERPAGLPVVEQWPGAAPRMTELVSEAARGLASAATEPLSALGDEVLAAGITGLARLESRASALRMRLAVEADRRRLAEQTADTGTDAWLARLTGTTREQAAGGLRIARLLTEKYAATREAFAAGDLRVEQVRVIVNAAEQAPAEATAEQVTAAEEWLVAKATGAGTRSGRPTDAKRLRQTARRMFAALDVELADRHEAILLGRETRSAEVETFFALHDNGNGTYTGRFLIPELHGSLLTQAMYRLTAPRRLARDRNGELVVDESAPGTDHGAHIYETFGAALCELIEHLPAEGWTRAAGNCCDVVVTLDLDALLSGLDAAGVGVARLDGGIAITAGEAGRLACGAGLIPAVLDSDSLPLDLGRSRRLHSATQRRAFALLHDTCAVAGCTRPFAWCEIHHHRLSWSKGGRTDLDNGLPLCGHHHRRAHDPRFRLRSRPDGEWILHRRT